MRLRSQRWSPAVGETLNKRPTFGRCRASAAILLASALVAPSLGSAQEELLTAADVVALEAPPPDHTIPYGDDPLQFGHLRLPDGPGPHPVVVFVHGGCWLSEYDIGHVGPLEEALAEAGYAVWSLEYRRVGDEGGGWPGTFLDVARGTDHLRVLAPEQDLDLERVVAAGHSAGGHLALWLAGRPDIPAGSELHTPDPLPIRGVFTLAPAPNLANLYTRQVCGHVIEELVGGSPESRPERYEAASPMRLVPLGVPQIVVVGAHDGQWRPSGEAYLEKARSAGDEVLLIEATGSGHFEMIVPTTSTWTVVRGALDELFRKIDPEGRR